MYFKCVVLTMFLFILCLLSVFEFLEKHYYYYLQQFVVQLIETWQQGKIAMNLSTTFFTKFIQTPLDALKYKSAQSSIQRKGNS